MFTYIYSLLIQKDICDHQNVSINLPCVCVCHSSGKSILFLFLFLCKWIYGRERCSTYLRKVWRVHWNINRLENKRKTIFFGMYSGFLQLQRTTESEVGRCCQDGVLYIFQHYQNVYQTKHSVRLNKNDQVILPHLAGERRNVGHYFLITVVLHYINSR